MSFCQNPVTDFPEEYSRVDPWDVTLSTFPKYMSFGTDCEYGPNIMHIQPLFNSFGID